jgi:hypothetical protein
MTNSMRFHIAQTSNWTYGGARALVFPGLLADVRVS